MSFKSRVYGSSSDVVKPFRVKESPVQFECKVNQIIPLGSEGGVLFSEVLRIHINETVLDANGAIDQHKIDLVSRLELVFTIKSRFV
jgi:flavin reductase (DIM6/NTAB) family NADH-FMN oxidoreductase RutF